MSNGSSAGRSWSWLPDTSHGFWRLCLLVSLMINIGIAGMLIGGVYRHGLPERGNGGAANYGQFVPRKFFFDVGRERGLQLGEMFRNSRPDFDKMKQQTGAQAQQIAAELANTNYDGAKVNTLVDSFTTGPESLGAKGGTLLKNFYAALTPEERTILARDILEKQSRQK